MTVRKRANSAAACQPYGAATDVNVLSGTAHDREEVASVSELSVT